MDNRASQSKTSGGVSTTSQFESQVRQHHVIINMITQMLAMDSLDEQLSLVLDTITAGLGYQSAAVAFPDDARGSLEITKAVGFRDNAAAREMRIPLDSGLRHLEPIHRGESARIARGTGDLEDAFLDQIGSPQDLLAFPLFGGPPLTESELSPMRKADFQTGLGFRGLDTSKTWAPAASCAVLYVAAPQDPLDEAAEQLLNLLSDCVGVVVAVSTGLERTERSIARLRRERQWVESIMKSVADPIVLTNLDNEILLQNRRAEELFSGSDDASEGKRRALKMNDLLFSAYLSSATVSYTDAVGRDLTLVDPIEGSDLHFEVVSTPALNELGEVIGLVSVFRDVTDLRLANEELIRNFNKLQRAEADARRERDRLNLIIENVGHPVVVSDVSGNFILFNRRAETLFRQEAVTRMGGELLLESADDSSTRVLAAVRANSVKLTSFISGLASETGAGRKAEINLTDPQTGRLFPMEITSVEVIDFTGQVTAVVSVLHDLSEVRELERRRVEQRLSESDKLAVVGTLAASIAHEVNNPLESIKNSLFLMQDSDEPDSRSRFLKIALKETERVSHIIRQMLGFARRGGGVEWVAINQLLDETLTLVENKLQHSGIRVIRSFDPHLPKVHAYPDQLRQVFLNLLLNAEQSIDKLGRIRIATSQLDAAQPSVSIEIADSGRGIDSDDLERIFEPFFTTRRDGTGLGLWVAQNIVRQHGGRIDVRTGPGKGTAFQIILPIDSLPLRTESVH
jgi:signal transduction histidine kinase